MIHVLSIIVRGVSRFFSVIGAAARASAAVEAHRLPRKSDLAILGIDKLPRAS